MQCYMCEKDIDMTKPEEYEYDYAGEVWCIPCLDTESDTGEVH